jgi:integrase/recombinase XerD
MKKRYTPLKKMLPIKTAIQTSTYKHYLYSFKEWLQTLGYSPSSVYYMPRILEEFLKWLEEKKILSIEEVKQNDIEEFITYNKTRKNKRREGALSISQSNRYIDVIKKFAEYLHKAHQIQLSINTKREKKELKLDYIILTIEEIKSLYQVTEETPIGIRDRTMLSIYYGCGLRKSEGINLEVNDILFDRKLVHVKKSKNNQERFVPITASNLQYIEQYIYNTRPLLLNTDSTETKLFINEKGEAITGQMLYLRLKQLLQKANIHKNVGLHTLRHSIATHLLQQGMALEQIALFLGHKSLESTQIYTHILHNEK